jgi:cation transporter-like permease
MLRDGLSVDLTESQMGYVLERVEAVALASEALRVQLPALVKAGVEMSFQDAAFTERYWKSGYEHVARHATEAGSKWVGSRILTAIVLAILSACVAWLVKTGKI